MALPKPALVTIACPHCGTRYQLDYASIGPKGRNVLCAHCNRSWEAHASPPPALVSSKNFDQLAEEMLDEKFHLEEERHRLRQEAAQRETEARAARDRQQVHDIEEAALAQAAQRAAAIAQSPPRPAPPASSDQARELARLRTVDEIKSLIGAWPQFKAGSASHKQVQQEFWRRQRTLYNRLPVARLRRYVRLASLASIALTIGAGVGLRVPIVQQFPQLAGAYAAIGLGVNVVGLDFRDVSTLQSLQQGIETLRVSGRIVSVAAHPVAVPSVIVTLLGPDGRALYQWSLAPRALRLAPAGSIDFQTQLTRPPNGAMRVQLSFANGRTAQDADDPATSSADALPLPAAAQAAAASPDTPTGDATDGSNPAR